MQKKVALKLKDYSDELEKLLWAKIAYNQPKRLNRKRFKGVVFSPVSEEEFKVLKYLAIKIAVARGQPNLIDDLHQELLIARSIEKNGKRRKALHVFLDLYASWFGINSVKEILMKDTEE